MADAIAQEILSQCMFTYVHRDVLTRPEAFVGTDRNVQDPRRGREAREGGAVLQATGMM